MLLATFSLSLFATMRIHSSLQTYCILALATILPLTNTSAIPPPTTLQSTPHKRKNFTPAAVGSPSFPTSLLLPFPQKPQLTHPLPRTEAPNLPRRPSHPTRNHRSRKQRRHPLAVRRPDRMVRARPAALRMRLRCAEIHARLALRRS